MLVTTTHKLWAVGASLFVGRRQDQAPVTAPGQQVAAAVLDTAVILVFAALGRRAHAEPDVVSGVLHTAWPFLLGGALGWLVSQAWRAPASVGVGLIVWLGAWAGGMTLRQVTGAGTAVPFVIVAALALGLGLGGWRLVRAGVRLAQTGPR